MVPLTGANVGREELLEGGRERPAVVDPVANRVLSTAFVLPSSAVEIWAGNGARGWGMRYLFVAYGLELFVFVGAPTLAWFVFFG